MIDKKLTDKEIMYILENCYSLQMYNIHYREKEDGNVKDLTLFDILGLFKRLQADIDFYKHSPMITLFEQWKKETKAEAYEEFAKRFKKKLSQKYTTSLWKVYCEEIDNLLKELVGDKIG